MLVTGLLFVLVSMTSSVASPEAVVPIAVPCVACRVCASRMLSRVLSLGDQTVSSFAEQCGEAARGPLDLLVCERCKLVQLGHTFNRDLLYSWYGYRSGLNPMMLRALRDLADYTTIVSSLRIGEWV